MKNIFKILCVFVIISLFFGCASTTLIRTNQKNAKIYVDGEYKGRGTVTHTDTKIVGSTTSIRIKKAGCEDQMFTMSRSEEIDVGALIGGCLVLVPFLWIQKYKPEHYYEFECIPRR